MAKIALRVYNNEISDLVDHGQLDEAIAHCRHILEQFPRYIETYRLFGKSYLEGNQYGDAADILQRVISSVPDDFVSQIGMSIIREDEGDLDAAIYHMERTFEAQPSNQAIQEELRRLYGRRDGVEPAKIRLTRGALARMYAHGNLFEQAVAELSAALSDDPSRLDLSVLLAEMYFKMDKHVEAADLCINILEKLPNNLSANRILFFILSQSNRLEESDIYKQIWISLDPYVEFLEDGSSDLSQVADNAVTIEKLPWDPELYAEQQKDQPDWVSSLGVSVEKDEDSADKNWIFSPEQAEKSIEDTAPVKVNDLGDDPLFTESDETDDEVLAWIGSDSEDSIEDQSTDDADGEIPDWILEGVVESEEGEGDSVGDDFPDMMKDFALAQELEEVTPEEIADEPFLVESVDSEDPEISEEANKIFSAPDLGSDFDSLDDLDIPENITDDWIKELEGSDQISEDELDENSGEFKEADTIRFNPDVPKDTPDWLKELSETGQHISEEKEEIPDWLKDTGELTDTEKGETDDIPSWLNDLADIESIAEQEAKEQPSMVDQEDQDSDATQEGDEADWLKTLSALESVDEDLPTPPHSALENKKDDSDEDNALAWLESLGAEDENSAESPLEKELELDQTDSDDVEEIETINQDDAVEWLENLGANKGLDVGDSIAELPNQEPIPDIGAESGDPNEMDDWLNSLLDDVPANQINTEDDDEWMETIADLTPEADPQKPPGDTDWLKELDEAAVPKNSEDESDKETTNEEDSQDSTLEEELVVSQSENETNFEGEGDGVEEKLSDDFLDIEEKDLPTEMTGAFTSAPQEFSIEDAPTEPLDLANVPDWMNEIVEEEKSINEPVGETKSESDADTSIDWLTNEETVEEESSMSVPDKPEEPEEDLAGDWIPESESGISDPTPEPALEKPTPKPKVAKLASTELLTEIKSALSQGDVQDAVGGYKKLIKKGAGIEEVVENINNALRKFPLDVNLWQILGDAFMKQDRLQEALDAYTKAEDLLR